MARPLSFGVVRGSRGNAQHYIIIGGDFFADIFIRNKEEKRARG